MLKSAWMCWKLLLTKFWPIFFLKGCLQVFGAFYPCGSFTNTNGASGYVTFALNTRAVNFGSKICYLWTMISLFLGLKYANIRTNLGRSFPGPIPDIISSMATRSIDHLQNLEITYRCLPGSQIWLYQVDQGTFLLLVVLTAGFLLIVVR
ncbi:hypothetical protein ARMGADRAFT_1029948 [Armillaria gallica]|uniref:Uncharacterized protein n=1 Tax=Armillaria gallica TaxID=47427 RepID=A0A2H3DFY7_ARMGA|nr:hypothetical protein ARMGADRAFT_1029948 [Armillaria gallica]